MKISGIKIFKERELEPGFKSFRLKQVYIFLLVFALIFIRYCYYGFEYFYQLDDYIQYHNYMAGNGSAVSLIKNLGLLAARPLAGIADITFWTKFFPVMIIGVALISAMFAASACLFRWVWARHFGTGWIFLVVYTLLPLGFEGTYWMSASTRIVTGLFFASLALYFFELWCAEGKRKSLVFYALFQLISYGFYEQVLVFSLVSVLLLAALHLKTQRRRALWGLLSVLNAIIYFAFVSAFSESALYSARASSVILPATRYYFKTFLPGVLRQTGFVFLGGGFFTLVKGFWRGIQYLFSEPNILYSVGIIALGALLFMSVKRDEAKSKNNLWAVIFGLILAVAPVAPFFVTENTWISFRGAVTSFCGIALLADSMFAALFSKAKRGREITAVMVTLIMLVCCVASVSELRDYRDTTRTDQAVVAVIAEALERDGNMQRGVPVGILNLEPSYLENQNVYFHEHIHGVTESPWALTGALEWYAGAERPYISPIPANPMYRPWNAESMRLGNFDALYLYERGEVIKVSLKQIGAESYELYAPDGTLLGYTWEENQYGYLELTVGS